MCYFLYFEKLFTKPLSQMIMIIIRANVHVICRNMQLMLCSFQSDKWKMVLKIILAFLNILQIIKRINSYSESVEVKYNIIIIAWILNIVICIIVCTYRYSENAKKAMKIFKDRPMSPESLVVYWTEYVLRHRGAPHLQSRALNLHWYQYYLLDVIGFAIAFISLVVFVIYNIFKYYVAYTKLLNRSRDVNRNSE